MMVQEITRMTAPLNRRASFMLDLFTPQFFVIGEGELYDNAGYLSADYKGGLWDFVKLSNDSGYAFPYGPQEFNILVPGNGFEGKVSAETYGIICTLFALSETCSIAYRMKIYADNEILADRFHALKDYVQQLPERKLIYAAID